MSATLTFMGESSLKLVANTTMIFSVFHSLTFERAESTLAAASSRGITTDLAGLKKGDRTDKTFDVRDLGGVVNEVEEGGLLGSLGGIFCPCWKLCVW